MKALLSLFLCTYGVLAMAQTGNFSIKGNIKNYRENQKVYFLYSNGGAFIKDSVSAVNGVFSFNGRIRTEKEAIGTLFLDHTGKGVKVGLIGPGINYDLHRVYLEPGTITINIKDSLHNAVITGSKLNRDHAEFDSTYAVYWNKLNDITVLNAKTPPSQRNAGFEADLESRKEAVKAEQHQALWQYVKTHPSSRVSFLAMDENKGFYPDYDDINPIFECLSTDLKKSDAGRVYADMLDKLKLVRLGANAPGFSMDDEQGKSISLKKFKGKYVLIDFWASWCGPCRRENPAVVAAYNQFKEKNFTILGVSLDQKKDAWLAAIKQDGLNWTQVSDLQSWNNAAAQLYSVSAIPQNFLIDPQGKIIGKNLFGRELTNKLAQIFSAQ